MQKFNKLVRDNIPHIIQTNGGTPHTRVLSDQEYYTELIKKLREETAEFEAEPSAEELADILEVVLALAKELSLNYEDLESVRVKKSNERGSFEQQIFLEFVE